MAGSEEVKRALDDLIARPIRHPHLFQRGILRSARSGILLFGPPGTGKTMLARAVACESGANFIAIGPADLNSKWVGEGEKYARVPACSPFTAVGCLYAREEAGPVGCLL